MKSLCDSYWHVLFDSYIMHQILAIVESNISCLERKTFCTIPENTPQNLSKIRKPWPRPFIFLNGPIQYSCIK